MPANRRRRGRHRRRSDAMRYAGATSLVTRILVVNLLALLVLAGALVYLDSFRSRLLNSREQELLEQGQLLAGVLEGIDQRLGASLLMDLSSPRGTRIRYFDSSGLLLADNWANPTVSQFELVDPTTEGFRRESAIFIDRLVDGLTGQKELPLVDAASLLSSRSWPEVANAARSGLPVAFARQTESRLVVLQVAVPVSARTPSGQGAWPVLLLTVDTPDVIDMVRRERQDSFLVFAGVLAFSLALSLFLARTIVVPLRQLALAAHRVRLGRARDVVVPRLPHRRDEIGGLARALADMTTTLRHRIDATEAFAADVAHELKNPLASLRSAVEALGRVSDPDARKQLFGLIQSDVGRIDRLVSDISAASRLDAELSRTRLQPLDLGALVRDLANALTAAGPLPRGIRLEVNVPPPGHGMVMADGDRLAQVVNNLIDNAISFSPDGGVLGLSVEQTDGQVVLSVEDEGPGIPEAMRDAVFERFYTERPGDEHYGRHSGLGLSIARAIVEALDGRIQAMGRVDGRSGARLLVTLPRL